MHVIGEIISAKQDKFIVHSGISEPLLDQLVAFSTSNDPDLRAFTGDSKRFISLGDTKKWIADTSRKIYTLTPQSNIYALAGFGWLRGDNVLHTPDTVEDQELLQIYQQSS
jgi:predicted MPP superfamily phosphohydrolase